MKKTKLTRSLLAACSIVALTAVMYGCVHSGDGPSQAELDAEAARAAAAEQAAKDAEAAQAAAEQQAAALQTQINGLRMQLGLEADDDLGDDIADLQAEVERLQAALQARIDAANAAAAKVASDAAKELLNMALPDVNVDRDDVAAGTNPEAPTITLSVSNDGMLMAEATGYTMSDMAPDMIEGWRGAMLTNMGGDTAVVYSDIGNDGTQTLLDRYASNLPTATSPRTWTVGAEDNTANQIVWSVVTRPDDTSVVSGPVSAPMVTFMGNVHNIPGTFSCAGAVADCVAPVRYSDGEVATTATGIWSFVPDEGALTYTDDPNYLTLGWWLDYGEDGKPDTLRLINTATGQGAVRDDTNTSGATIRGSATYMGAAAGKYAMASGTADTYEGGHFTAMATLMVDFDADLTPVVGEASDRAGVAISGMIDNFMTGDMARPDWSVALMVDNNETDGDDVVPVATLVAAGADTSRMLTEWSTGTAQSGTGTWTAAWHDGQETARPAVHPAAVTGTFNAHIGPGDGAVGRIQGAFGCQQDGRVSRQARGSGIPSPDETQVPSRGMPHPSAFFIGLGVQLGRLRARASQGKGDDMNHSRIKASVAALAVAALVGLSACGGGDDGLSRADEEALQAELAAAEEARRQAELEQARAEAAAEEARRQRQAAEAERQREEQARQAAEEQRRQEEEARQAAEAEQQRLREEAQQAINRAQAKAAFDGLGGSADTGTRTDPGTVTVEPKYRALATVTTTPSVNFASKSRSSSGRWSITTQSNAGSTHNDDLVVYSDLGGPSPVLITESTYSGSFSEVAGTNNIRATLTGNTHPIASGRFPGGGRTTTFTHHDRFRSRYRRQ